MFKNSKQILIGIVGLLLFMESMDATVLNTSLPQIAKAIHDNPIDLKVALTSYLLSMGLFIPVSGWLADRFGASRVLKVALVVFILGSMGCGVSNNLDSLVIFRIIQGIGGALMMPIGRLVLLKTLGNQIVTAMPNVAAVGLLGAAIGPLLGGALTTYISWRWIFYINFPIGLFALWVVAKSFPVIACHKRPFNWLSFLLFCGGLALLLTGLDIIVDPHIPHQATITIFIAALVLLSLYAWQAKHAKYPLLSRRPFKDKTFRLSFIASALYRLTSGAYPFLFPLMIQAGYGYSAMHAGLLMVPLIIGMIVVKIFVKPLFKRVSLKTLACVNLGLLIIAAFQFYWLATQYSLIAFIVIGFCFGFLNSMQFSIVNAMSYTHLDAQSHTDGTSIYSTMIQVASSFAVAVAGVYLTLVIGVDHLQQHVPLWAFRSVFIFEACLMALSFLVLWRLDREQPVLAKKLDEGGIPS